MDTVLAAAPAGTAPTLLLRPWTDDDIPAMLAAHRDPVLRRWLRRPITTAEQARQLVERLQADGRSATRFPRTGICTSDYGGKLSRSRNDGSEPFLVSALDHGRS